MGSLKNQLSSCQNRMHEIRDEIEGIGNAAEAEARDITEEESQIIEDLRVEFEKLEAKQETLKKAVASAERVTKTRLEAQIAEVSDSVVPAVASGRDMIPANCKGQHSKYFESDAQCFMAGKWLYGALGHQESKNWAIAHGMDYRNEQSVGTPGAGGYTVPTPLAATIIRLIEEYGVFRRFSRNMPMTAMTLDVPRRTAGLTVYYPGENTAITASDITVDQVNLVAKKYALLNIMSTELAEDAIISWTDLVAEEMAWSIALAEDTNSFLGDGTGTYGGITGIANALQAGSIVAGGAGLWGGVSLTNLEEMIAKTPAYAGFRGRWYMNKYAYYSVVVSLLNTAGGTDMRQIEAGGEMMLMGYPVTFTQVLPGSAGANGDMVIVFGDLALGSMLGVRRALNIRLLTELYAAQDSLGIVCTSRSDTVIHDVGDATNAGAITALTLTT